MTTRAEREAKIQLKAYAKWNPDNDPQKEACLLALQEKIDRGVALQLAEQ